MSRKKYNQNIFKKNKNEIKYNIYNSLIAGLIALCSGILATSQLTTRILFISLITGLLVMFTKFKDYWDSEKREYSTKLLNFM